MTALDLINAIAEEMTLGAPDLSHIRNVTEDGEALAELGLSDEDQEMVEEAHWMLTEWMDKGFTTLDQVK